MKTKPPFNLKGGSYSPGGDIGNQLEGVETLSHPAAPTQDSLILIYSLKR